MRTALDAKNSGPQGVVRTGAIRPN